MDTVKTVIVATTVLHNIAHCMNEPEPSVPDDIDADQLNYLIETANIDVERQEENSCVFIKMDLVEQVWTDCEETPKSAAEVCEEDTLRNTPRSDEGAGPSSRKRRLSFDTPTSSGKSAKRKTTENLPNTFLEVAKEIMQKIDTKQHTNPNRTFCNYLFSELEKLSEAEAKEKRKQILMNVFSD
nr:unnamed protein product [Callosobruchus analis]